MPGRKLIQGRLAISTLIAPDSGSSSPAWGNWRTTVSAFSSESTSLNSSVACACRRAARLACPSGSPSREGTIAAIWSLSAMSLSAVVDLDADQLRKLVVRELEHLHPEPAALVHDDQVGDPIDAVDALHHRVQIGLADGAAERPAVCLRPPVERVEEPLHLLLHVGLDAVGGGAGLERDGQLERDRHQPGLADVDAGGDQPALVDVARDAVDQVAR